MARRIITEADILAASAQGLNALEVDSGRDLVTAQARDTALALGVRLGDGRDPGPGEGPAAPPRAADPARASDLARQIVDSLRGRIPAGLAGADLEGLVRQAVAARTAGGGPAPAECSGARACGVCFVDGARLLAENGATAGVRDKAVVAEVFGREDESKLAAGYLVWERASFDRLVDAPEICVVVEGELHLTAGGETLIGKPGDMLYLPRGVKVLYSAPGRVKLACVGHRA
jgi:ethanolamine utilization protein EutQ